MTAVIGKGDFAWVDGLRRQYYPADRNLVPAHITLMRHLPPSCAEGLQALLAELARSPPPSARIDRLLDLDGGVALHVESPALLAMRDRLVAHFHGMLMPQDIASPRLHITIQNKVAPAKARATYREVMAGFTPRHLAIHGLACWHYRGGPWAPIRTYPFRG